MNKEERKNIIYEALKNKNQEKLKELNVNEKEINEILSEIDNKLEKLDTEEKNIISEVENDINYQFPKDFKNFILGKRDLHIKPNLFKVNGQEKILRYINSFDKHSITYIGKIQNFDSKYKDSIVPFAELEFGDNLCFDRKTNKIVIYNHEEDTIREVAENWNKFYSTLYNKSENKYDLDKIKNQIQKSDDGYEYNYNGLSVIITNAEVTDDIIIYGNNITEFYLKNKNNITNYLFKKLEKYTKEQIVEKIGNPTIYVRNKEYANISYLDSKLDEHLITIELYKLNLDNVYIDG